jgi:chromosome segregation protein
LSVHFRRLRIAGFKSFAEPVSVEIHAGLTGIVGPNGCGKSNVVEALRWAMGEQSTRSLRAGEMDDVIFAGTAGRPSRNLAEVTLTLDDTAGAVPPPFHDQAELEIVRRIARGAGSEYRVNGKEVRARDVQTLFADLATGAHASGMVSQGRVGALITARPEDRRAVLEEAAGITGLHARRHEAELKLRAAETNLARADDLRGQLEVQLGALKRQARQASRYRNISGAIRQAEAELLAIQRACAGAAKAEAEAALHKVRIAVAAATQAATQAGSQAAEAAAALPPLRAAESEIRTALERHRVAQEQIAAEEERARSALTEAATRLSQIGQDLAHAERLRNDSGAAESRLALEEAALTDADSGHAARAEAARATVAEAAESVRIAEAEANGTTEAAAEANARAQAVARQLAEVEQRCRRLDAQLGQVRAERDRIGSQAVDAALLAAAACPQQRRLWLAQRRAGRSPDPPLPRLANGSRRRTRRSPG